MCKKQNKKSKISANLVESLLELAITITCFTIGILVLWLFGVNTNWIATNVELALLIGCIAFILLLMVARLIIIGVKKLIHRNKNDVDNNQPQP